MTSPFLKNYVEPAGRDYSSYSRTEYAQTQWIGECIRIRSWIDKKSKITPVEQMSGSSIDQKYIVLTQLKKKFPRLDAQYTALGNILLSVLEDREDTARISERMTEIEEFPLSQLMMMAFEEIDYRGYLPLKFCEMSTSHRSQLLAFLQEYVDQMGQDSEGGKLATISYLKLTKTGFYA